MAINKVVFGNRTLIDLTADTVTAATLLSGTTAHAANGNAITGTYQPQSVETVFPVGSFYATDDSTVDPATELGFGTWTLVNPVGNTWGDLKTTTWGAIRDHTGTTVYVYKRTA